MMHSSESAIDEAGISTELSQRLAQALQAERLAREEARLFHQLKQTFLANVSHELRTPLTVLQGYLGLLERRTLGPLTQEQHEALVIAQRNLDHLSRLINDLLDFSLLARGQARTKREPVSVSEVSRQSLRGAANLAQLRRVTLESRIADGDDMVMGDPEQLRQILDHLLENAIKFSGTDHRVVLEVAREESRVRVTVSDTGIGMTPEQLNLVFLPFVQGETGLTRRFGGLGMGLSLVHHLVTLHGGDIEVRSKPGEGTMVTVSLPAR